MRINRRQFSAGLFAAAGAVDHHDLVRLVERGITRRGQRADDRARSRAPLARATRPTVRFQRKETEQYHLCLGAPGVSRSDHRRFAALVLDAILGGSASSRLFQEIREKRGMAYSVYSYLSQYSDTGQIGLYIGTREENLAEAVTIALAQIEEIAAGGVTDRELRRAKESLKGRIVLSMESTSARMNRLGMSLVTGTEILTLDRVVAEIEAVAREVVSELAAVLLAPGRLSAAGIGILAQASPMMQDMFSRTPLEAAAVVSIISLFNAGGRFTHRFVGADFLFRHENYIRKYKAPKA